MGFKFFREFNTSSIRSVTFEPIIGFPHGLIPPESSVWVIISQVNVEDEYSNSSLIWGSGGLGKF